MRSSGTGLWADEAADQPAECFDDLIGRIARAIVARELTVPAIVFLESVKPLSFLGNQFLVFLNPMVSLVVESGEYYRFVRMLEDRENVEKLLKAIEDENARESERRSLERLSRPRRVGILKRIFRGRSR